MKLNRAHIVGLYGLVMNSPVNATVEVRPTFVTDDMLCRIEHEVDGTKIARVFKLVSEGGTVAADIRSWPEDPPGLQI